VNPRPRKTYKGNGIFLLLSSFTLVVLVQGAGVLAYSAGQNLFTVKYPHCLSRREVMLFDVSHKLGPMGLLVRWGLALLGLDELDNDVFCRLRIGHGGLTSRQVLGFLDDGEVACLAGFAGEEIVVYNCPRRSASAHGDIYAYDPTKNCAKRVMS